MLHIDGNNGISLTRGDTAYLTVPIYHSVTGEEYTIEPDDTLTFTCKRSARTSDVDVIFQKVLKGTNQFHILPEDTANCEFRTYKYDVQLTKANGDVCTVIEPTNFKVTAEVTF